MGENPSFFSKGADSIIISGEGKSIRMNPDHPVENITWWSALEFANRLSEKHGLKPAYDLKGVTWQKGTRAENGTLQIIKGEAEINKELLPIRRLQAPNGGGAGVSPSCRRKVQGRLSLWR